MGAIIWIGCMNTTHVLKQVFHDLLEGEVLKMDPQKRIPKLACSA
jgi:hypothetical protein